MANNGSNTIERLGTDGSIRTFVSTGLGNPTSLAFDKAGNLYAANSGNSTIEKFAPDGTASLFASTGYPAGLAFDAAGNLYTANQVSNTVTKFTPAGAMSVFVSKGLNTPDGLAFDAAGNLFVANRDGNTIVKIAPDGTGSSFATTGLNSPVDLAFDAAGILYVANKGDGTIEKFTPSGAASIFVSGLASPGGLAFVPSPPSSTFFTGQTALSNGVYYLSFSNGDYFGYYSYLSDPHYIYHFDLGYEYVFDAQDGKGGVYFYDFASRTFFYTSPTFPFPYLYDFTLNTVLYYYPDPNNAGRYNTNGVRYFFDFATGKIITK